MTEESELSEATKEAESEEARQAHVADRAATPDEEAAAESAKEAFKGDAAEVAEHFEEMADIGAHVKGEGEIE
jgi:hypothetical protein